MKSLFFSLLLSLAPLAGAAAPTVPELAQAAREANARGEAHRAIHYLQQILDQEPGNESALRAQARLLGAQGYPVQAGARWARLPKDAEALQGLAAAAAASATAEAAGQMDPVLLATASAALEPGQGVWVNGDLPTRLKAINAYNLKAPRLQRLRHVFVAAGAIRLSHGKPVLSLDLRPVRIAGAGLQGEAQAHLWLTVQTRGARGVSPAAWQALAGELAAALKEERRVTGVQLQPDAGSEALAPLLAALRAQVRLPISLLVPSAVPSDFMRADLVVLRGWGKEDGLEAFRSRIRDQVSAFMRASGAQQSKAMIGLPVRGPDGLGQLRAGREALGAALTPDQPGPMGLALMGLVDDASGLSADWAPEVWDLATVAVEAE